MKKLLLTTCAFSFLLVHLLQAAAVSNAKAQVIAINFFKVTYPALIGHNTNLSAVPKYTQTESDGSVDFYVFDITPLNGFVIVSADDAVMPVLAYSNESYFNTGFQKTGVANWTKKTGAQVHNTVAQQIPADERINSLWAAYTLGIAPGSDKSTSVGPLLTTIWNQEPYYNEFCPINPADGQYAVTGCVATAMAQIMKYWNYPAQGTGSFSYIDDNAHGYQINAGPLSANFGTTTYQWTQMPTYLTGNNTAVATLMSHCGISVAMDYSDAGSGAWVIQSEANTAYGYAGAPCAENSYITYFSYNPATIQGVFQNNYSASQWTNLMEAEMNAGRVVQYEGFDPSAGGHTWVCDGYDANNNLHMNWGWGGIDNGFFAATNLSAGGYTFSSDDAALIGIEPLYPTLDTTCTAAASFTYQNNGGSVIQFTNNSTSSHAFSSAWTFYNAAGPFATSNQANPQITFIGVSPYSAQLIIIDTVGNGCTDTARLAVNFNANTTCISLQLDSATVSSAEISSNQPALNFDGSAYQDFDDAQWTSGGTPFESRGLLKYNLSAIPVGSLIVSASLSLYADTASSQSYPGQPMYGTSNASYISRVTSAWNPATVTWNTQPTASTTGQILLPQSTSSLENYLNIDISSFAQAWVDTPGSNYGIVLKLITQNYYNCMLFCSSGYRVTSKRPKLEICYIPTVTCHANASFVQQNLGAGQVLFTNTSTDNSAFSSSWTFYNSAGQFSSSNAVNPTVTFTGQQPYSARLVITDSVCSDTILQQVHLINCLTLQQGATKATGAALDSYTPTTNFDFTTYYEFFDAEWTSNGTATESRSLMRYDLSQIPAGSVILSAQLSLFADSTSSQSYPGQPTYGNNNASYLHFVTSGWNPATVTWNTQPQASNTNQVLLPQSTNTSEDYLNIDISGFVQDWVNNPNNNNGMLLEMLTQNHYNCMLFCSPGNADSTRWPKLDICYQIASPCQLAATFVQQNQGNGQVQFTNTSATTNNTVYYWAFYNSTGLCAVATTQNPLITFTGSPPFSATLRITDAITGCTDSLNKPVNITSCMIFQPGQAGDSVQNVVSAYPSVNQVLPVDFFAAQWTFNGSPGEDVGLLKFDLSAIPSGTSVISASLSLTVDSASSEGRPGQPTFGTANACYLQQLTAPWASADVNWDNQPLATTTNQVLLPQSTSASEDYPDINITPFVQNWVRYPAQNYGLRLKMIGTAYYNSMIFCSSIYPDSTRRPVIQICYFTPGACSMTDSFTYQNLGGDSVQFTNLSTSAQGYSSSWVFSNANGPFANSTQTNPLLVFTGPSPYYTQLTITDTVSRGCVDSFASAVQVIAGILQPNAGNSGLYIFPNPNNGKGITVRLPSGFNYQTSQVKVFDVLGREIVVQGLENYPGYSKFLLGNEASGIYTVVVSDHAMQQCGKLVLTK